MIKVKKIGKILEPTKLTFENRSVLNPAVYQEGNDIHIIYRAIDDKYMSCFGYAKLNGPTEMVERSPIPFMYPKTKIESQGIEDLRIVKIKETFYMTYIAHNGKDAISALAAGDDLFKLKRCQVLSPKIPYRDFGRITAYTKLKDKYYFFESYYQKYCGQNVLIWHKDSVLFPEKINNQFYMLHRILPDVQLVSFESFSDLKDKYFWIYILMNLSKYVILEPIHGFEMRHLGAGCPPIRTDKGWLIIYHSAKELNKKRVYYGGAALLDLKNPFKVIGRLPYPLIKPTEDYELRGTVNDVVFPTGTAIFGDNLYIYYGAADKYIAVCKINLDDLINEILANPCE